MSNLLRDYVKTKKNYLALIYDILASVVTFIYELLLWQPAREQSFCRNNAVCLTSSDGVTVDNINEDGLLNNESYSRQRPVYSTNFHQIEEQEVYPTDDIIITGAKVSSFSVT